MNIKCGIKHLLIITPGFPSDEQDTTCLPPIQQFLRCYKELYPQVAISIISLEYPYHSKSYNWHGNHVFPVGGKNKGGINKWFTILKARSKGLFINRGNKVDAIISLWLSAGSLSAKMISRKLKIPHLVWMQGQDAKPGNKYFKLVAPLPAQLAAISDYQNEVLSQSYGIKATHVINNGINQSSFPAFNNGHRKIDLLAVGSLIPLKQYHLFVEMVKVLKEKGVIVTAVLAGKGPEEENLRKLIADYQLERQVQLTGELSHNEVLCLMNDAKIFIHPSSYEGHSTVILEALYSGCKVLAFMPVGNKQTEAFTLCETQDEMIKRCEDLLKQNLVHDRIVYSDMKERAEQMHLVLLLMKQNYATDSRP